MVIQRKKDQNHVDEQNELDRLLHKLEQQDVRRRQALRNRIPVSKSVQRHLDEVDYWRKRAGWYDDDEQMSQFNNGVYNSYYSIDDDGSGSSPSGGSRFSLNFNSDLVTTIAQVLGAFIAIAVLVALVRAISAGSSSRRKKRSDDRSTRKRSSSRRRSGSRSRSKSRARSRSRRGRDSEGEYDLMEDGKSSRSRSRSKARNRSKSRSRRDDSGIV